LTQVTVEGLVSPRREEAREVAQVGLDVVGADDLSTIY
jgi:hypothetical protein